MSALKASNLVRSLGLALCGLALLAPSAMAEPVFSLELSNDPTTLPRTDERMTYEATVSNTASAVPQEGDTLTCQGTPVDGKVWTGTPAPTFVYQWVRNGEEIAGETSRLYESRPGDAGEVIQCIVTATNQPVDGAGDPLPGYAPISSSAVSIPPVVLGPGPVPVVPSGGNRPDSNSGGVVQKKDAELICTAPTGWSGNGITWTFQWLRNGEPIPGETSTKHKLTAADTEPTSSIQCEAIAEDSMGHRVVSISFGMQTEPVPPSPNIFPSNGPANTPAVAFDNTTSGPVTVDIELPEGSDTFVYQVVDPESEAVIPPPPAGWDCSVHQPTDGNPGEASCTRSDSLAPGDSYPSIEVIASLGEDAPEPSGTATATVSGGGAEPTADTATYTFGPGIPFGILDGSFEAGVFDEAGDTYDQAGGHPYRGYTTFGSNVHRNVANEVVPTDRVRDVLVDLPRGFQGNALATPEFCPSIEAVSKSECPPRSVVGGIDVFTNVGTAPPQNIYPDGPIGEAFEAIPIYSLEPEFGQPAQFAFVIPTGAAGTPITFVPELRPKEGYAISFRTAPIVTAPPLWGTKVTLCDFGAKLLPREGAVEGLEFSSCRKANAAGSYPDPLITNPTRCDGIQPEVKLNVNSWEDPGTVKTYKYFAPAIEGCEEVEFEPEATIEPTSTQADSPTGLEVEVEMPTDGLLDPKGIAQSNLNNVEVTFPKGMSLNPSTANGLGACSPAQVKMGSNEEATCPLSSRVGEIEIETPIIRDTLEGAVYLATQGDNPLHATAGLYMVFSSKRDGVTVKIAGKVQPDPVTGQLTASFTENPQAPFSRVLLKLADGPRAPLVNPPKCGTYSVHAEFSPWSAVDPQNPTAAEIVSQDTKFRINRGPGGGPCPKGDLEPKLSAGLADAQAGSSSPFGLRLSREDGTQRFTATDVTLPKGLTAKLAGIPYCPESALASVSGSELTGRGELASPSCPAASQIGTLSAMAGAGLFPLPTDTGKAYLAGPYKGAPLSLALIVPAVAGPLDLGSVLTRAPVHVDPETATVTVKSDPIPTMLHGFALNVRDIRVNVSRPGFIQAPTSCEPMRTTAGVWGDGGGFVSVSDHFQMGGCDRLGFKPQLTTQLFGSTSRGGHPRLKGVLRPKPGEANIEKATVTIPRSEFLDQAHIRTICTRVQFAADACPKGSIYGKATAITPLLDYPLTGPVYLRSSDNELPDMVVAVKGPEHQPIEAAAVARIDSIKGQIRANFESIPDVPLSKVVIEMRGGNKGLLINSRDICARTFRASVELEAHNDATATARPVMRNGKCGKVRRAKHKRR